MPSPLSIPARQRHDGSQEPANHIGQTLSGIVLLDGGSFVRCRFRKAVLIYAGGEPPRMEGCEFDGAQFQFDGAAARTLALLKAMAGAGSGLRPLFKASFPTLFGH
ncbi:hypothetical protein [Phenylobacterium sp.]|uniref:hypothetical protein n=1 Tax=Phenylobacterium sp. TaxID=1871053 RepID=UPI0025D69CD3|nr:hypothetical protein [Phenylobacterium sp.]